MISFDVGCSISDSVPATGKRTRSATSNTAAKESSPMQVEATVKKDPWAVARAWLIAHDYPEELVTQALIEANGDRTAAQGLMDPWLESRVWLLDQGYADDLVMEALKQTGGSRKIAQGLLQAHWQRENDSKRKAAEAVAASAPAAKPVSASSAQSFIGGAVAGGSSLLRAALGGKAKDAAVKDSVAKENEENRRLTSPVIARTVDTDEVKDGINKKQLGRSKSKRDLLHKKNRQGAAAAVSSDGGDLATSVTLDDDDLGSMSECSSIGSVGSNGDRSFNAKLDSYQRELKKDATFNPDSN